MSNLIALSGPKSFGTSKKKCWFDEGDKSNPGPGAHDPMRLDRIENPQWAIGNSTMRGTFLDPHRRQYPSPQHYKVNRSQVQKQNPQHLIPRSKHQSLAPENVTLNAALYKPDLGLSNTEYPKFSFGYSQMIDYNNGVPGPGTYKEREEDSPHNKTQNHFGRSNRPLPYGEEGRNPGPSQYFTINSERGAKYSFAKSQRAYSRKGQLPGVYYNIGPHKKAPMKNRIYDIKGAQRETIIFQPNQNPAPNHYNIGLLHKIEGGTIENSQRSRIQNLGMLDTPSPVKYAGERKQKRGGSFTKDVRRLSAIDQGVPGPGVYQLSKTLSNIGGAVGKGSDKGQKFVTPSCSQYKPADQVTRPKVKSTIVLKADRADFSATITKFIGPGEYNLIKDANSGELGKIGRSERRELSPTNNNPGVGNYNITGTIGKLPNYYTSPKKLSETGFSTFHEQMKFKMLQRQKLRHLQVDKSPSVDSKDQTGSKEFMDSKELEMKSKEVERG